MMSEQSAESVARKIVEGWYKSLPEDDQCISIGHRRDLRASITAAVESERSNDTPCQSCGFSAFRDVGDGEQDVETCVICEQREKLKEITTLRARLEAAKKWQRHDLLCGVEMSEGKPCTCGLSEHQKGE